MWSSNLTNKLLSRYTPDRIGQVNHDIFNIFVWLLEHRCTDESYVELFRNFLAEALHFNQYKDKLLEVFYSVDATDIIEKIEVEYDQLLHETDKFEKALAEKLLAHKDAPLEIKRKIYEKTLDKRFLPQEAKDAFLF
jgi:hypothetical protein